MYIFILILFISIILIILFNNLEKENIPKSITKNEYEEKEIMTDIERYFYSVLKELEYENNIIIHPQLNLASILNKKNNTKYVNELFRNIDFAIFDKNYKKILLLIEINDKTHKTKKRKNRDIKVKEICKSANIPIIFFYTDYKNEKNYIKTRIIKTLNELNNKNIQEIETIKII